MTVLDWADELDMIAATQPGRTPLVPDPALMEAFADDQHGLPLCACCARPMRPKGTKVADWPGTVSRGGRGHCGGCRRRQYPRRRGPNITTGTPCLGCQRPLRSSRTRHTDAPGTVQHVGRGRCNTCYQKETSR